MESLDIVKGYHAIALKEENDVCFSDNKESLENKNNDNKDDNKDGNNSNDNIEVKEKNETF